MLLQKEKAENEGPFHDYVLVRDLVFMILQEGGVLVTQTLRTPYMSL